MAKRVKNAGEEQSAAGQAAQHKVKDRVLIRQECAQEVRRIQGERAELNDQMGDIRKRLRDCGIDVPSFMAGLRIADMTDAEARSTFIDGLHEQFAAMGIGEQGDWIKAAEAAEAKAEDRKDVRPRFLRGKGADVGEPAGTA